MRSRNLFARVTLPVTALAILPTLLIVGWMLYFYPVRVFPDLSKNDLAENSAIIMLLVVLSLALVLTGIFYPIMLLLKKEKGVERISLLMRNFLILSLTLFITAEFTTFLSFFVLNLHNDWTWSYSSFIAIPIFIAPGFLILTAALYIAALFEKSLIRNPLRTVLYGLANLIVTLPTMKFFALFYERYIDSGITLFLGVITPMVIASAIFIIAIKYLSRRTERSHFERAKHFKCNV